MNDKERILELLRAENPFVSSSVGDPWEEKYLDINAINEMAFSGVFQLIRQKTESPALPCAGLVFGETGSGKTHLISRILRHGRQTALPFSFAYIQPIEDPERTYRYLLREIMVNLCYPLRQLGHTTQLDLIVEKIMEEIGRVPPMPDETVLEPESLPDEFRNLLRRIFRIRRVSRRFFTELNRLFGIAIDILFSPAADEELRDDGMAELRARFPDIPKSFFKVLFQYRLPEKRAAAVEWLKGVTIDASDAALLEVADRGRDSVSMREHQARNILTALGTLLAYCGMPLVICFDRLENYDTPGKIRSLGVMIEFLVDQAKAMLPLVFVRGAQWEEKFRDKLNQQVSSRLATNEFSLKGCQEEQALEIVRSRLESVIGAVGEDFYPFDRAELARAFKTRLYSPRQVIMLANQRLRKILWPDAVPPRTVPSSDTLRSKFEAQLQAIRTDADRYPPDRERLRRALDLYLAHRPPESGFDIEDIGVPEDKFIDFRCSVRSQGKAAAFPGLFVIDVEQNSPSVRASLKRGIDFLEQETLGRAIYIRDGRCEIPEPPQWQATNDMLQRFREIGGHVLFLDEAQAARWYALALLSYAVREGDITVTERDQSRPVSYEELGGFIRDEIHVKAYSGFRAVRQMLKAEGAA